MAFEQFSAKLTEIVVGYDPHAILSLDPAQWAINSIADHLTAKLRVSSNSLSTDLVIMIATNIAVVCDIQVAEYQTSLA